ncbi:MAG: polysaccharide deacetylase family protein [Treponema sp.]|nr:polysaccharide deacetylase family protein [Treponema sp.]
MKKIVLVFITALCSFGAFARISFGTIDLNSQDEVLFTVKQDMTGTNPYRSLFYTKLKDGKAAFAPKVLTCFPEQMELLNNGEILQIRNRYGIGHYDIKNESFAWQKVESEIPENSLPVIPYAVSPDGKWICKIEKETLSSGVLIVQNVENGKTALLCDEVRQSYEKLPVKWAPDSSLLLYEKEDSVYFCNPDAVIRNIEMDEKYRKIGRGTINSVCWASEKNLVYVDDYLVYQINSKELYTIGLYSGIIGQGKTIGRFPFQFNPKTDKFSASANMNAFVVIQNEKLFSYLRLNKNKQACDYMDVLYSKPYTDSTASLVESYVFWDDKANPILWLEKLPYDGSKEKGEVYILGTSPLPILSITDSGVPLLSPDGKRLMFFAGATICVYDINSWKRTNELSGEKVISAVWSGRNSIFVGTDRTIKKWNLISDTCESFLLSAADAGYWDKLSGSVVAANGTDLSVQNYFKYNSATGIWKKINGFDPEPDIQNGRYRVFTGTTPNKHYENALYIRSLSKMPVTIPMYEKSAEKTDNQKKVALVFDCYDNADGLSRILSMLKKYKVDGTFFVNGEFIRRYPAETKQIVKNNFMVGSMFFSNTDLVNNPFLVDEDFVRRGLARNEDEFFQCTNSELSVFWHTPYYTVTPAIIGYGNNAGYTHINSFHNYNDSEKLDKDIKPEVIILNYCRTLAIMGGGIVPVSVGFSQGNRTDPLYDYLDLLICALIDCGFELVPITEL